MIALVVAVGSLVTVVEPGTTAPLCTRVSVVGEGPGGVATVWGVQLETSRGVRAALSEVRPGGPPAPPAAGRAGGAAGPAATPVQAASAPR